MFVYIFVCLHLTINQFRSLPLCVVRIGLTVPFELSRNEGGDSFINVVPYISFDQFMAMHMYEIRV